MKITLSKLEEFGACEESIPVFKNYFGKSAELTDIVNKAKEVNNKDYYDYILWLLPQLMDKKQRIKYAVFSAELVLHIYEEACPDDNRPRKAIEAAKKVIDDDTQHTRDAAYTAADAAARAANAAAAAAYAARAANAAARAAAAAARAAYAAYAAYTAADAAEAAAVKIIDHGMGLLKKSVKN